MANTRLGVLTVIVILVAAVGSGAAAAQIDDGDVGDNVDDGDVGDNVDDGDVGDNVDDGSGDGISISEDPSNSIDIPDSATVGQSVTATVVTNIPSIEGSTLVSRELTVRLFVDDEEVNSTTVDVSSDGSVETELSTTFDTSGETEVTVESEFVAEGEVVTRTRTATTTVTIDVSEAVPETSATEGAAFAVPESLEDEVEAYRSESAQDLNANAFVLANENELYVVFTREEPTKGLASVEGPVLERELPTENISYGVIAATSTSFETSGTERSIQEVVDSSDEYRLDLVTIDAHYRRASILTDPDNGDDFTFASTAGALLEDPNTATSMFSDLGGKARTLSQDATREEIESALQDPQRTHLDTFSFETKYWADADASVDGIVLDPAGEAKRFVTEYSEVPVADTGANQPILYVVEEDFQPQEMDDISSIKTDADSLDGEVVEVEARVNQGKLSVQETLEEGTETCGEDLFPVQTPEGTVCVNIAADELLHSGAAWSTVPQSRDQVLTILGASSHEQDEPTTTEKGQYQIVGEVVSSSRIDGRLPDSSVLVIYDMERTGDIDYNEVASEGKNIVETRRDQLRSQLQQQIGEGGAEVTFSRSSKTTASLSAGESASVSFDRTANTDIALKRASVSVSTEIDDVEVSVGEVSLPEEVEQPPGQSLRTLNISSSAGEDTVANASFQLRISREVVSDVADVKVHRYHDGEWIELNTTVVREDESSVVVEAETEGFSYFAVTTEDTTESSGTSGDSETGTTSDGSPGFTPLTLVIAVLSFLGIQLRRLE